MFNILFELADFGPWNSLYKVGLSRLSCLEFMRLGGWFVDFYSRTWVFYVSDFNRLGFFFGDGGAGIVIFIKGRTAILVLQAVDCAPCLWQEDRS